MTQTALITGISGQDGSYLAEQLLQKGYVVHGLIRRSSTFNTARIDHLIDKSGKSENNLSIHYFDSLDSLHLLNLIENIQPNEIYNLAALSHVAQSYDQPEYSVETVALGFLKILEVVRIMKIETRIYQASTSELFGKATSPQSEETPFEPISPYASAKLMAHNLAKIYREAYGMFISTGILFNHESPRRGRTFVTRKISSGVADILKGKSKALELGNLESRRDWGFAPEYTDAMWKILQLKEPTDLVISTGTQYSVKDFCKFAFDSVNLDWKVYVKSNPKFLRPLDVENLCGDSSRAKKLISWEPKVLAPEIASIMVKEDLQRTDYRF